MSLKKKQHFSQKLPYVLFSSVLQESEAWSS